MEISPEPKDSNDYPFELPRDILLEFLKVLMGEDGLVFLNLDNAITSVEQAQPLWQASFAISLWAFPLLYQQETDSQGKFTGVLYSFPEDINSHDKKVLLTPILMVFGLSSQTYSKSKDIAYIVNSALKALEAHHNLLNAEVIRHKLTDKNAHILFHTRLALGVLLILKGDEKRATTILRQMAATKTAERAPSFLSEGLTFFDVVVAKNLAALVLQDFYARKEDYEMVLFLLTEAIASRGIGPFSDGLLLAIPRLLESFAKKCEGADSFENWIDLFDGFAKFIEICGEADTSGNLPETCKLNSPQYLAWLFGQFVARYAIKSGFFSTDSEQIFPFGYLGEDWGIGTVVASLLYEYKSHRNWQALRQQYVSMWESLSRYNWLSLCEAGPWTDLYWAMRIGFADQMVRSMPEQTVIIQTQNEIPSIIRDIEMTKDIASTVALWQLKLQKILEERLPLGKQEARQQLQQRLLSVWSKLPAKVVDTLVKADDYYRTGVNIDDAKVWFNKAAEASLNCCFVEPLVSFVQKRGDKRIAICFPHPRGVERKTSSELRKLPLWEWSKVFETLSVPVHQNLAGLGTEDLMHFIREHFGDLPLRALRELSHSLRDFCQYRKDSAHSHLSRYEEEIQELDQMRELVLGTKRLSVITQIFQLFSTKK